MREIFSIVLMIVGIVISAGGLCLWERTGYELAGVWAWKHTFFSHELHIVIAGLLLAIFGMFEYLLAVKRSPK